MPRPGHADRLRYRVGAIDPHCAGSGGARRSGRNSGRGARPRTRPPGACDGRSRPGSGAGHRRRRSAAGTRRGVRGYRRRGRRGSRRPARAGRRGPGPRPGSARRRPRGRRSRTSRRPATGRPRRGASEQRGDPRGVEAAFEMDVVQTLGPFAQRRLVLARAGDPEVKPGQMPHGVDRVLESLDLLEPAGDGHVGAVGLGGGGFGQAGVIVRQEVRQVRHPRGPRGGRARASSSGWGRSARRGGGATAPSTGPSARIAADAPPVRSSGRIPDARRRLRRTSRGRAAGRRASARASS